MDIPVIIQEICCGNKAAEEFCASFYDFAHVLDDLIDRDKPVAQEAACGAFLRFLQVVAFNPFFAARREALFAIIHTSVISYIHSNKLLATQDVKNRVVGEVLKSEYQGVFFYVAFCCGGFCHQLAMQEKYRDFQFG